jgi:hypothetical protein
VYIAVRRVAYIVGNLGTVGAPNNHQPDQPLGYCNPESLAAHARVALTKRQTCRQIMSLVVQREHYGIIADEVTALWGCSPNHVAPRITELKKSGLLVETDHTRPTRTGSPARVLVAKQFQKNTLANTKSLFGDLSPERHRDDG